MVLALANLARAPDAMDRYERRARSRSKFAIRAADEARADLFGETKPPRDIVRPTAHQWLEHRLPICYRTCRMRPAEPPRLRRGRESLEISAYCTHRIRP
jgi:2-polyprenyl-6-methoxyphenol hydroxylase-like FAD-dependent oxidoreductase